MSIILGRKPGGSGGGGGAPSGPAGGDLGGTYPNPTVESVQADAVDTAGIQDGSVTDAKLDSGAAADGTVLTADGAGGAAYEALPGAFDPVQLVFGTPTTAFEFSTSSLAGLQALGSPDVENADTTIPDAYFIQDNATGGAWCGRLATPPATPWTAITRLLDSTVVRDSNAAGLLMGVASPGGLVANQLGVDERLLQVNIYTNPTTFSSNVASLSGQFFPNGLYFAIRANSGTSFDYLVSMNGYTWTSVALANNPSLTIARVGVAISCQQAGGIPLSAAFDYLRIWNSALTFPGV